MIQSSLNKLFVAKIFRIPDYQRGYAWQRSQLEDFWEDLINLPKDRSHYTGVLTLKEIDNKEILNTDTEHWDEERWLVADHSYKVYHVVDGQQRLTSFVIFLQAFIDFTKQLGENGDRSEEDIYITESLNLKHVIERYLFQIKPRAGEFRTYKFGYTVDNPSYEYLKHKIFKEPGGDSIVETFYTLNLKNAERYFYGEIKKLYDEKSFEGLRKIYNTITKHFLFNEYVIDDEFDVFVAFETMNNRGKNLSDLELLKNRLIYLTTLYTDKELDVAGRRNLRNAVNDAWKVVYHQLGRNDTRPLNDDDFLRAHWIMYFKYSRKQGKAYAKFLLNEQFPPQRIHKKIEREEIYLKVPEVQRTDFGINNTENESDEGEGNIVAIADKLLPSEIENYVKSLKDSAVHWFNSHYPDLATGLLQSEKDAIDRLNRIKMGYFRPLVMSILKNETASDKKIEILHHIERFIFIVFRLCRANSNYCETEFCNAAREFNEGRLSLEGIKRNLDERASSYFHDDGTLNSNYFYNHLDKKFNNEGRNGFYDWNGIRYFLYEYELRLQSQAIHKKVLSWEDFLKNPKDKVSIEHVFPRTPTSDWQDSFSGISEESYHFYSGSIGNLLLLSMSINSSLQNQSFEDKKRPKTNGADKKKRNGYFNGSHSEIEVAEYPDWTPAEIEERGLRLLDFMEDRWNFKFRSAKDKKNLLFLSTKDNFSVD